MALTDGSGGGLSAADVAAVMGNNGNGFGLGGDGAWWLIVLFLFALSGNNGFGFGGGCNADMQRGFDQSAVMSGINGLTSSVSNGFANAEVSRCNSQTNLLQAINNVSAGLQNCCCENRASVADLKYTISTEAANNRSFYQAGNQAILDKLCQLEMDGIKQNYENRISGMQNQIDSLRAALAQANDAASQSAQTASILRDNAAQTVALEQYLNPTPVPAYIVQNPNCCSQGFNGCGCGA